MSRTISLKSMQALNTHEVNKYIYLSFRTIYVPLPTSRHGKLASKISLGGVCSIISCQGSAAVAADDWLIHVHKCG
jgi:hypothetical protein